ncbi:MAG: DUF6502 family protein [Pseudomonadota bacterium]
MRSSAQEKLLGLLYKAIKPLVHVLLELGIGHREFAELSKRAFVEVATNNYGIRGRATNISRVAVMTGLTRKEVKKIRDEGPFEKDERFSVKGIPGAEVLHRWHSDPVFLNSDGSPKALEFADSSGSSFGDLVKKYAGDIPPGALRTELIRSGAVKLDSEKKLHVIRREYAVSEKQELIERAFGLLLPSMTEAIAHNVIEGRRGSAKTPTWPEYQVYITGVRDSEKAVFRDQVRRRIFEASQQLDDELHRMQSNGQHADANRSTIVITSFYAEGEDSAETLPTR